VGAAALQLLFGLRLLHDAHDEGARHGVCIVLIVGITRAWELVGGPQFGFTSQLRELVRALRDRPD